MSARENWTPGPWKIVESKHRNGIATYEIQYGNDGELVCYVDSIDQMPDCNLIAAAPELYAELKRLDPANPVLAKARGEK